MSRETANPVTTDTAVRQYDVAEDAIPTLKAKLDALVRKAKKLSLGTLVYEIGPAMKKRVKLPLDMGGGHVDLFYHEVLIVGEYPIIHGWKLVAKLMHTDEGNIIVQFDANDDPLPAKYRTSSNLCEHCCTARKRKETFVIRNEEGQYKQIGTDCLGDFVGYPDPAAMYDPYALLMQAMMAAQAAQEEGGGEGWEGVGSARSIEIEDFLAWTASAADRVGWLGRAAADASMRVSTVDTAISMRKAYLKAALQGHMSAERKAKLGYPTEAQRDKARKAIEWILTLRPQDIDNFTHNLRAIAEIGRVDDDTAPFAVWIVRSYENALERQTKGEQSGWVGKVGDRITLPVTLLRTIVTESMYGTSYGHVFSDSAGNELMWWTSSRSVGSKAGRRAELTAGSTYTLVCSVKEHTERKGVKQTTLTRCDLAAEGAKAGVAPKAPAKVTPEMLDILAHAALFGGVLIETEGKWSAKKLSASLWSAKPTPVTALRNMELLEPTEVVARGKPNLRLTQAGVAAAQGAVADYKERVSKLETMSEQEREALKLASGLSKYGLRMQESGPSAGKWGYGTWTTDGIAPEVVDRLIADGLVKIDKKGEATATPKGKALRAIAPEVDALRVIGQLNWIAEQRPDLVQVLVDLEYGGRIDRYAAGQVYLHKLDDRPEWVEVPIAEEVLNTLLDSRLVVKGWSERSGVTGSYSRSVYGSQFLKTFGKETES